MEIQILDRREVLGKQVQTFGTLEEPLFLAKDVANWIGYSSDKVGQMIKTVDEDEKQISPIHYSGQVREMWFLTEDGLYEVLMQSRKPIAKQFKKEVKKILKQIRCTGGYIPINEIMTDEEIMAKALMVAQRTIEKKDMLIREKDKQLEVQAPKVLFADAVSSSSTSILVGELAKLLKQNGVNTGQKRLFEWLRENGYLIRRKGSDYNMPTQRSMDLELFEIKETSITHSDGHISISKTPKVTGKGQIYFINKLKVS